MQRLGYHATLFSSLAVALGGCTSDVVHTSEEAAGDGGASAASSTGVGGGETTDGFAGLVGFETSAMLYALAVGSDGSIYLGLRFYGPAVFGGEPLNPTGGQDFALVKLDRWGQVEWAHSFGGLDDDYVHGLALAANGDLIACGLTFGSLSLGGAELHPEWMSAFIARYTPSGAHVWSTLFDDMDFSSAEDCVVDQQDRILVAIDGDLDEQTVLGAYSADGRLLWAATGQGSGFHSPGGVAVDDLGNLVVGATLSGEIDLGTGPISSDGDAFDVLVTKYSPEGQPSWSTRVGGPDGDGVADLVMDTSGIVVGGFADTIYIPNDPDFGVVTATPFAALLGNEGQLLWTWLRDTGQIGETRALVGNGQSGDIWAGGHETVDRLDQGFLVRLSPSGVELSSVAMTPGSSVTQLGRRDPWTIIAGGEYEGDVVIDGTNVVGAGIFLLALDETAR